MTSNDILLLRRMYGCGKLLSFQGLFKETVHNYLHLDENFTTTTTTTTAPACQKPHWKGDGWCDDMNNVASCDYDGGDCCGNNVKTTYCTKCECLDPNHTTTTTKAPCNDNYSSCSYWAGKGYCTHSYVSFMTKYCKKSCNVC